MALHPKPLQIEDDRAREWTCDRCGLTQTEPAAYFDGDRGPCCEKCFNALIDGLPDRPHGNEEADTAFGTSVFAVDRPEPNAVELGAAIRAAGLAGD